MIKPVKKGVLVMNILKNLDYNEAYIFWANKNEKIELSKTLDKNTNHDYYFLKYYFHNGIEDIFLGYMYFFIDFNTKKSKYIGTKVNKEYRGQGIATKLMASWIKLCLDNDILSLQTNRTQRKPYLLHLLKQFFFEIDNVTLYETYPNVIYICKNQDKQKTLYFKDDKQKQDFMNSSIYHSDDYLISNNLNKEEIIDQVILTKYYRLHDNEVGYTKTLHRL